MPGILAFGVVSSLIYDKKIDNVIMFIQMFIYGIFSYFILWSVLSLIHISGITPVPNSLLDLPLLNPSNLDKSSVNILQIVLANVCAIAIGLVISINTNTSLLIGLCQKLKITKRFSDPDVWSFIMNSKDTDYWITIRHIERGHIYQGYLQAFSGKNDEREILLTNVAVYDIEEATPVGEIPFLYLAFKRDAVALEFGRRPTDTINNAP